MAHYEFLAAASDGRVITGQQWAESELALDRELEGRGLTLRRSRVVRQRARPCPGQLRRRELVAFSNQLATLVSSGVRLVEGLEGIAARTPRAGARVVARDLVERLKAGASLSEAMGEQPESFPPVYRASVAAGEASGALDSVLQRLARYLEWMESLRATAVQALIYPLILLHALVGLVGVLLYFVLPRILTLFPGGGEQLPAETRAVVAVSNFLRQNGLWLALGVALAGTAAAVALRVPRVREGWHALLLRVPKLGSLLRRIAAARFAATASTLQGAGCDVFSVLEVSGATSGNAALAAATARSAERVRKGATLSQALSEEPSTDPLLLQMVAVGESSGSLDSCLAKLASYYDEEVPREVKRFLAILEPAMLVGAGIVVGFVLLAALLPIFDLYEKLS